MTENTASTSDRDPSTPTAPSIPTASPVPVTSATSEAAPTQAPRRRPSKRALLIAGASVAGVLLLAGAFGGGVAVGSVLPGGEPGSSRGELPGAGHFEDRPTPPDGAGPQGVQPPDSVGPRDRTDDGDDGGGADDGSGGTGTGTGSGSGTGTGTGG